MVRVHNHATRARVAKSAPILWTTNIPRWLMPLDVIATPFLILVDGRIANGSKSIVVRDKDSQTAAIDGAHDDTRHIKLGFVLGVATGDIGYGRMGHVARGYVWMC